MGTGGRERIRRNVEKGRGVGMDSITEVRRRCPTAASLLQHKGILSALGLWSMVTRICNMNTERDLATVRLASALRCWASRFLASGFLAPLRFDAIPSPAASMSV